MKDAVFINGVYEDVLEEIREAQGRSPGLACFLQPYKSHVINLLRDAELSEHSPVKLYLSVTDSLDLVSYVTDVVGWEDKREVGKNQSKLNELNLHIKTHQPNEGSIYLQRDGDDKPCVNLIAIGELRKLKIPFSVTNLVKTGDGLPCKPKTRSGGWSYVFEAPDMIEIEQSVFAETYHSELEKRVSNSKNDQIENVKKRLQAAPKIPEKIQLVSQGYRRNADVIVAVLDRANGICEACGEKAPFVRKSNSTPYLEVHHRVTLAAGGDDSVENATAVCPNCHRQAHFG